MSKLQTSPEEFNALPYELKRDRTRLMIDKVLETIDATGAGSSTGKYDNLRAAMKHFADRDFLRAVISADRAQNSVGAQMPNDLLDSYSEPDRSVPLRDVWEQAKGLLSQLEAAERPDSASEVSGE